jgi:UDPglucose 6-dehydrogenase
MKLCVVGTGYVGLVAGACFAESGRHVICVDIDEQKVKRLREGIMPIYEPGLDEVVLRNHQRGNLQFSTDLAASVDGVDICFIAVGTPPAADGSADLTQVFAVAEAITKAATGPLVVAIKSTVPVGTQDRAREICEPHLRHPLYWASNPEFLREGLALKDFLEPDRVVIGAHTPEARDAMRDLYRPFVEDESKILFMAPRDAELCKYACNAMLATRISFMNDLANLCEVAGADIDQIRRGMGTDHRIGPHFLFAGSGYGGSCFPGHETIQIRHNNQIETLSFEELFTRFSAQEDPDSDGMDSMVLTPNQLEVLSWNPETQRFSFSPVSHLTRRGYEGEIIELRTKMGRRISCTPDHPFFTFDADGRLQGIKLANAISQEDWLPLQAGHHDALTHTEPTLDLTKEVLPLFREKEVILRVPPNLLETLSLEEMETALAPLQHPRGRQRLYDIRRCNTLRLHEAQQLGLDLSQATFGTARNGTYIPSQIPLNEDFWRVVGYYLAEGHISTDKQRERIYWSFHPHAEDDLVDDVLSFWRNLQVEVSVYRLPTSTSLSISSRILAALFRDVLRLGVDSYDAAIPSLLWSSSKEHRRALLSGLWRGDGSYSLVNDGPSVVMEYGTVSPALADGMLRLLSSLGIIARLKVGRTRKSTTDTYWLLVSGAEQVEQLCNILRASEADDIRHSIQQQKKRIAPTGYRQEKDNPTARLRVAEIEQKPYTGPVYSLETALHTIVTSGGLVAHNCFPKDTQALLHVAREYHTPMRIVQAVEDVNADQKAVPFHKLQRLLGQLDKKTIAVWGLAFKPETDDMREAPSVVLINKLIEAGARVQAYDPVATETASLAFAKHLKDGSLTLCEEAYQALKQADALVLITEWLAFRDPDFEQMRRIMRQPILIDGRNIYSPEKLRKLGFTYEGIGRR